ncbi:hypothetical protein Tco_1185592 [Tanacetum coccineum]
MIPETERLQEYRRLHIVSYGIKELGVVRPLLLFFSSENRLLWFRDHVRYLPEYFISIWLEYGVLVFLDTAYWILFPSWSLVKFRHRYAVSSLMDMAYWLSE